MRKLALILGLSLAATAHADKKQDATAKPAAPADPAAKPKPPVLGKNKAILLTPTDLTWVEDPKRPGTWRALGEGNPDKGPAHFFLKYEKGFAGGEHYHTYDHGGWVLQGTVILVIDGQETKLPPGSFYFIKGRKLHIAKCDPGGECIMTVSVKGKWDAVPAKPAAPPKK